MQELIAQPLKLLAKEAEELQVLSAYLQDSLLPWTSITFDEKSKKANFLLNRFCWEHLEDYEKYQSYFRVHTALQFHHVKKFHQRGFDLQQPDQIHCLLSIITEQIDNQINIHLVFSEHKEIKLEVNEIEIYMADIDHPWYSFKKPMHLFEHIEEYN